MTMTRTLTIAPVRKSLHVAAPQAVAFAVFTEGIDRWWPRNAHIGASPMARAIIEPRTGGRWYHRCADGSESPVGHVLVWQPPERLVLAWQIGSSCVGDNFHYDPSLATEVEVRFIAESAAATRVEFEHRHLDRIGDGAEAYRAKLDGGWAGILEGYAAQAAKEAASGQEASR